MHACFCSFKVLFWIPTNRGYIYTAIKKLLTQNIYSVWCQLKQKSVVCVHERLGTRLVQVLEVSKFQCLPSSLLPVVKHQFQSEIQVQHSPWNQPPPSFKMMYASSQHLFSAPLDPPWERQNNLFPKYFRCFPTWSAGFHFQCSATRAYAHKSKRLKQRKYFIPVKSISDSTEIPFIVGSRIRQSGTEMQDVS